MTSTLPCWIYKSPRKDEMYLYLPEQEGFAGVPDALMAHFGKPVFVMRLELHAGRLLAGEDVAQVMRNLGRKGYHLQMPRRLEPWLYHGNAD